MAQKRKTRSDKKVKTIEKELGITLHKPDGKKHPANKKLGTIRDELTEDQKIASKRKVRRHPKENPTSTFAKQVRAAIKAAKK